MVIHFRNTRLRVNAGMDIAECVSNYKLLDTSYRITTGNKTEVTCKKCLKAIGITKIGEL